MSEPSLSILYVDDEPLLLKVTREYLEIHGFIVDIAESGHQALQKISERVYDAVVSDYMMPGMDGIELLKEIRRRNLDIPYILFTGRGREEVVIQAIENGADFYLQKGGKPAPQFSELKHKINVAVQRRRDSRALRANELRFRSLIQNSSDIIRILDIHGAIVFDSPSSSRILGYPEGSLVGLTAFDFIHPEDQERVRTDYQDVLDNCNTHAPTEYRIRKADGTYLYVESIALNLIGVPGIDGIVTTTHSIQHQKIAEIEIRKMAKDLSDAYEELASREEELRENYIELAHHEQILAKSEERFRGMAERSSDLIFTFDREMRATYASPSARLIIGYDPVELIGQPPDFAVSTIYSESGSGFTTAIQKTMSGETVSYLETQISKKDGTPIFVSLNAVPTMYGGVVTGAQVSMRDITAIKNAEKSLIESEKKFRRFATNAQDMLYRISLPDIRYEYVSPASIPLTGYTPEEFYSDPGLFKTLIHPAWKKYFREQRDALLRNSVPPNYEYQIVDRSGNTRWFNHRNVLVTDEHGYPVALEGIVTDVTRQKNNERELRRREQRFIATTLNAGSWIWETDPEGIYTYSSPAVEKILGYLPDELVGKVHYFDLFDPSVREDLKAVSMKAFISHEPFCGFINPNRHKNGSQVILKTSGTPVFDDRGIFTGYCGVDEDITKEKEAGDNLRKANRQLNILSDITRHDILNNISVIYAYLELFEIKLKDPGFLEYLRVMITATKEIQAQIGFTRVYEELGSHEPLWVRLDTLLPCSSLPDSITMKADFPEVFIFADPMVQKIFSALLDNSIRHGKRVSAIRVFTEESDRDLTVIWEDNGVGIDEKDKERIFEQGFGKNTGLGMFLVREILSLTGISVRETGVQSKGARFEIAVPKVAYRYTLDTNDVEI